jgi:hypothetical protein
VSQQHTIIEMLLTATGIKTKGETAKLLLSRIAKNIHSNK